MIGKIISSIVGTQNERELKKLKPKADVISSLESKIAALSDAQLRAKTDEFKAKIKDKLKDCDFAKLEKNERRKAENEALEEVLPEAFAVVREAGKRNVNMRHFDV
ncbi:MAG: preprotein translocase subunit SecA, partial [Candidatus Omnitrophota bacterium]|nr:preprotein translocase subunit SecA [Candidatus Omnitrophota bacterium]